MKHNLFFLYLAGTILSFNVAATSAAVPVVAKEFGLSPLAAGKIVWLYMLAYGIFSLFYIPLCRYIEARRVFLANFLVFSLANLGCAFSPTAAFLFFCRLLMGLSGALFVPLAFFLAGSFLKKNERGKTLGSFFAFTFISSLAGLFLSGIVNWRLIYFLPGAAGLLGAGFAFFQMRDFSLQEKVKVNYLRSLQDKRVQVIFLYIFFVSAFYHSIRQWLGVFFDLRYHLSQFAISMLLLLGAVAGILGEAGGGFLADKIGRGKVLVSGIFIMSLSLVFFALIPEKTFLGLIMAMFGFGWTFNHIGLSSLISDLPSHLLSASSGLNSSVRFLAGGTGAFFAGQFLKHYNFSRLFLGISLSLVVLHLLLSKMGERKEAYGN